MNKRGRMIGEFVLIVVGVMVALMVEAGLESRKDEQLRDEYLSRIQADIEADKQALVRRIGFFVGVKEFSQEVVDWLDADIPINQQALLASFYAAEIWPFRTNLSTYQDLHSTGNIRLLEDLDLRTSLAAYYNKADASRPGWSPSQDYRKNIRGIIPTRVQNLMRDNCPTTDAFDQTSTDFPPCVLDGVDYEQLATLFEPLREDTQFRRTLTYRDSELGVMIYLLRQQVVYADEVLVRLQEQ
jgi:hypothetical protein